MNYQEFIELVTEELRALLGSGVIVQRQCALKNNGIVLEGVMIQRSDTESAPTIYLEAFFEAYKAGESLDDIVRQLIAQYLNCRPDVKKEVEYFANFSNVKPTIAYKLVNYERNKELLKTVPHKKYLDLAVLYYSQVKSDLLGYATILINYHHLENWNITKEMLMDTAVCNAPLLEEAKFACLKDIILHDQEIGLDMNFKTQLYNILYNPKSSDTLYVITNKSQYFGAAVILYADVLEEIANALQTDFYLLPGSVHEFLLISVESGHSPESLKKMVEDVNMYHVRAEEVLSNHIYIYSIKENQMKLVI